MKASSSALVKTLLITLVYLLGTASMLILFNKMDIDTKYSMIISQVLLLLVPTVYVAKNEGFNLFANFKVKDKNFGKLFLISLLGLFALELMITGYMNVVENIFSIFEIDFFNEMKEHQFELLKDFTKSDNFYEFMLIVLIIAILPGICEEVLYRGYLQVHLEKEYGFWIGVVLSGLIFAFIHFDFINFFPLMMIGVFLAYVFHVTGNLLYPMILHFLNNLYSVIMMNYFIEDYGAEISIFALLFGIASWATGLILLYLAGKKLYEYKIKSRDTQLEYPETS